MTDWSDQGLNEEIGAFVGELVSSGDEEVERLIQVEVVMAVKMPADEIVDLFLRHGVQVLEWRQKESNVNKQFLNWITNG